MNPAGKIAFKAFTNYLTSTAQYIDSKDATIQAAEDIYGACSDEYKAVVEAWKAVGVYTTDAYTSKTYYGTKEICSPNKIQLGPNFVVESGATVDVRSLIQIRFRESFEAKAGSEFTAKIGCCH